MKRQEITAIVVWVLIGLALVVIFNIYPHIKLGIIFAALIIGGVVYRFWQQRKQEEGEPENRAKRPEVIANLVWLLIAGVLIAAANIVPQLNEISSFALVAVAIGIIFYRAWQEILRDPIEQRLYFSRGLKIFLIIASVLFAISLILLFVNGYILLKRH